MKVIGKTGNGQYDVGDYVCVISHNELAQYLGMYYSEQKLEPLRVGQELDLSKAYHFASRIESAVSKVQDLVKNSQDVINAIMQGMNLLAIQQAAEEVRRLSKEEVPSLAADERR
jgi:hypothetical protein